MDDAAAMLALTGQGSAPGRDPEQLIGLVLDTLTSPHSRRSYRAGLEQFFGFVREETARQGSAPEFSKALAGRYRLHLLAQNLAPATVNLRLSPVRKLADGC